MTTNKYIILYHIRVHAKLKVQLSCVMRFRKDDAKDNNKEKRND